MNKIVQEATLYYKTLPLSGRVLVHATIIVVVNRHDYRRHS